MNPGAADDPSRHHSIASPLPIVTVPDHELIRPIGEGSCGEVWLARNAVGTVRAVKVVRRQSFEREENFEREFKGLQKFEPISRSHDGFVDILQLGRNEQAGYYYYVMELADAAEAQSPMSEVQICPRSPAETLDFGHQTLDSRSYVPLTLRNDLRSRGALPLSECLFIGLKLAAALEHLHAQGLVHRDIKPSNIIFVNGEPKLADIGLVTNIDEAHSIVGTLGYIPLEGPGKPQADIFSLGKVLYEIAFGKDRQDFPQLPPDLQTHADHAGLLEINEVIIKACESDPRQRYKSAEQMRADLELLQQGRSVKRRRAAELGRARLKKVTRATSLLSLLVIVVFSTRQKAPQPLDPLTTGKNVGGYPPTTMRGTRNLEAWIHYKLGWFAHHRPFAEGTVSAEDEFSEAIRLDPEFALAYGGLFFARFGDTWLMTHAKSPDEFRGLAAKMVELDNGLAETHAVLGFIKFWEWKWADAENEYREALTLNPDCMPARVCFGFYLADVGRSRESLEVLESARQVDPTNPQIVKMMGHAYFVDRDFTNALAYYGEASRIEPSFADGHLRAFYACLGLKDYPTAIKELETCGVKSGDDDPMLTKQKCKELQGAFDSSGSDGFWHKRLDQAKETLNADDEPYDFAKINARLGNVEETFKYLGMAYDRHDQLIYLIFDELWDRWREHPQFKAMITKVGLAELERDWLRGLAARRAAQP